MEETTVTPSFTRHKIVKSNSGRYRKYLNCFWVNDTTSSNCGNRVRVLRKRRGHRRAGEAWILSQVHAEALRKLRLAYIAALPSGYEMKYIDENWDLASPLPEVELNVEVVFNNSLQTSIQSLTRDILIDNIKTVAAIPSITVDKGGSGRGPKFGQPPAPRPHPPEKNWELMMSSFIPHFGTDKQERTGVRPPGAGPPKMFSIRIALYRRSVKNADVEVAAVRIAKQQLLHTGLTSVYNSIIILLLCASEKTVLKWQFNKIWRPKL